MLENIFAQLVNTVGVSGTFITYALIALIVPLVLFIKKVLK